MKKDLLLIVLLLIAVIAHAQSPKQQDHPSDSQRGQAMTRSSLRLDINTMNQEQAKQINSYISSQRGNRGFGTALLSTLASSASSITINEIVKATQIRKNQKEEWTKMIKNECQYTESLAFIDNLTDFYSAGSSYGALDPADMRFNGFTLSSQNDGEDVLKFYCHVSTDTAGLNEIYNHSKFRLVMDSLYFYPYRCHLPNLSANHIFPEKGKKYDRDTHFSFEERENLIVNLSFTISSSWYNEAIILAKDVELGTFNVQIPINKNHLTDSVYVYKCDMKGVDSLNISGDCFLVPRSYMPLPGGVAHWGTGEYDINVTVSEQCNISKDMEKNWKKDYRYIKRMKHEKNVQNYFINLYNQNGSTVIRQVLETTSSAALEAAGLNSKGMSSGAKANTTGNNGTPTGGKQ